MIDIFNTAENKYKKCTVMYLSLISTMESLQIALCDTFFHRYFWQRFRVSSYFNDVDQYVLIESTKSCCGLDDQYID